MSVSSIPASGVASPSTLPGRCERNRADASVTPSAARAEDDRGRALVRRAQHPEVQRFTHDARRQHLLRGDLLAEHRVRVVHAVPSVLHDHLGQVVLREPVLAQQSLRAEGEVRGRRREAGFLAPRLEERRSDDALRHLLDTEHEHAVVLPGADRTGGELERGATARATGFDIDDRDARTRERTQHLVTRRHAAVRSTAERGLERRIARLGERGAHRVHAHVGVRDAVEATERMDADAGDAYANAHVTIPFGSGSATSCTG